MEEWRDTPNRQAPPSFVQFFLYLLWVQNLGGDTLMDDSKVGSLVEDVMLDQSSNLVRSSDMLLIQFL